jgi:hypothetical protein
MTLGDFNAQLGKNEKQNKKHGRKISRKNTTP